jgi:hypothetical protein
MKKIILSATVAMLLPSPAFAQSYSSSYGTGNVIDQQWSTAGVPGKAVRKVGFKPVSKAVSMIAKAGHMPPSHLARRTTNGAVSVPSPFRLTIRMSCMKTDNMSDAIRIRTCGSSCVATGLTTDRPLSDSGTPKQAPAQARLCRGFFAD